MKINLSKLESEYSRLNRDLFVVADDGLTIGDVIELIRVARAAIEYVNKPDREEYDAWRWYSLKEALKEIEA